MNNKEIKQLIKKEYTYPELDDEEFQKKIPLIIDGGASKVGIESTVIDLTSNPKILRPGRINKKLIEKTLKFKLKSSKNKIIKFALFIKFF